jgi:hypothetical protein
MSNHGRIGAPCSLIATRAAISVRPRRRGVVPLADRERGAQPLRLVDLLDTYPP